MSYEDTMKNNLIIIQNLKEIVYESLRNQALTLTFPQLNDFKSLCYEIDDLVINDIENRPFSDKIKLSVSFRIDLFANKNDALPALSCVYAPHRKSEYWNVKIEKKTNKVKKFPKIESILNSI